MSEPNPTLAKPLGACSLEPIKASWTPREMPRMTLERALPVCDPADLQRHVVDLA